jgi:hypothetical protein
MCIPVGKAFRRDYSEAAAHKSMRVTRTMIRVTRKKCKALVIAVRNLKRGEFPLLTGR